MYGSVYFHIRLNIFFSSEYIHAYILLTHKLLWFFKPQRLKGLHQHTPKAIKDDIL